MMVHEGRNYAMDGREGFSDDCGWLVYLGTARLVTEEEEARPSIEPFE